MKNNYSFFTSLPTHIFNSLFSSTILHFTNKNNNYPIPSFFTSTNYNTLKILAEEDAEELILSIIHLYTTNYNNIIISSKTTGEIYSILPIPSIINKSSKTILSTLPEDPKNLQITFH